MCLGGLSDAVSMLRRGLGGCRQGKTLKLDRDLSRPSDMRGAPGEEVWTPTPRAPTSGRSPEEEGGQSQSWGRGCVHRAVFQEGVGACEAAGA